LNTRVGHRPVRTVPAGPVSPPGEAAVAGGLIAPVIPSAIRPARHGRGAPGRPGAVSPLPLASMPPGSPEAAEDVVYGIGRIDSSGRVADRAVTSVLGWRAGDRLTLTAGAGVVVARRDPGGMVTVPARPYIVIPAALRRRCGLHAGDRVLLAAMPGEDRLAAYSFAVVDKAIRAHGALPFAEGACS
jgi:AbrB family looped-hinge helix DNA binding protein